MPAWLLDTNVVSELRKGVGRCVRSVWEWAATVPPTSTYLARITVVELRLGVEATIDPAYRAILEAWLRDGIRAQFAGRILEADEDVLMIWRRIVIAGQRSRYTFSTPDALIAATALRHGLGVATRNVGDFERAGVALVDPWKAAVR